MSKIPQAFIDDLLTRINIVDLINKRIALKKTGSNYSARCPFHNEKSPSFSVSERKQFYYCFGCGVSGNAISFLMEYEHLSFIESIESLAQQAGVTVPYDGEAPAKQDDRKPLYEVTQKATEFYYRQLLENPEAIKAKDYLKNRGLTGQITKHFQIGYAPSGWNNLEKHLKESYKQTLLTAGLLIQNDQGKIYDRFRERVIFPIRDRQGRVVGFGGRVLTDETPKYLNSPETPIFHKGSELYGLYEALETHRHLDQILVVEGYMDVIALAQHGITYAVATLGTATTQKNAERLFRETNTVIFCFDGDNAGQTAAWRALENILPILEDGLTVKFMFLPNREDPDSYVRKHGQAAFIDAMKRAKPLSTFLLDHIAVDIDLSTIDGRSRLAKNAEPLLKQIPGQILQQLLIDELAKRTHIDVSSLRQLFGLKSIQQTTASRILYSKGKTSSITPMQQTMSILLQYPAAVSSIDNIATYAALTLPGSDLLNALLALLKADPSLSIGALLEHWRDEPRITKQLSTLASRDIVLTEENAVQELHGLLNQLVALEETNSLSKLHEQMARGELSDEDKRLYLNRIKNQKK